MSKLFFSFFLLSMSWLCSCNPKAYPVETLAEADKNTRRLDLSDQNLTQLPEKVATLSRLTYIDLSNNPQLDWQDAQKTLTSLRKLNEVLLDHNATTDWAQAFKTLSQLERLKRLHLPDNNWKQLPEGITLLKEVTYLNLSYNPLKQEETWQKLAKFDQLETLLLTACSIEALPDSLPFSTKLVTLDLMSNYLIELPSNLSNFKHLRALNLSNNSFDQYPASLLQLDQKIALLMKTNGIKTVPEDVKDNKFTIFDLSGNPLTESTKQQLAEWIQADLLVIE